MTVKEALDALTLAHVWDLAANANGTPVPRRDGVFKSPLRLDKKGKSFSVFSGLKAFKDQAEPSHKGGVWQFVQLAKPEWSKQDVAREIISRAGGDPDAKDPDWKPPSKLAYKAERMKARDMAAARVDRENHTIDKIPSEKLQPMPQKLERQWSAMAAADYAEGVQKLAAERGWPVEWVDGLVLAGKLVFNPKGECVFAVDRLGEGLRVLHGWHARWFTEDGGKAWSYRPNMKFDRQEVAALPFILGSVDAPLWVLCEGQWDAATVYGMLGGFEDVMCADACVFGVRGASGVDVFLSAYQKQLRRQKPAILLLPDADKAGRAWTIDGKEGQWCFMRRLRKLFDLKVTAIKFKKTDNCKDVNDFYQHGGLTADLLLHNLI